MTEVSFSQKPRQVQLNEDKGNSLKQALFDTKTSLYFSKGLHISFP